MRIDLLNEFLYERMDEIRSIDIYIEEYEIKSLSYLRLVLLNHFEYELYELVCDPRADYYFDALFNER